MQIKDGIITHDGIDYIVVFHQTTAINVRKSSQVKLSFRKPDKEFDLTPYVLIKPHA